MGLKILLTAALWAGILFLTPDFAAAHTVEQHRQELVKKLSKSFNAEEIKKIFSDKRLVLDYSVLPPKPKKMTKKEAEETRLKAEEKKKNFMSGGSLKRGLDYFVEHQYILLRISKSFGVDPYTIVSILRNETNFGSFLNEPTLAINAMYSNYVLRPKWKDFMLQELTCFIKEAKKNDWDLFSIYGSTAGAIGYPQFTPCSIVAFAVDGDSNGKIDLFNDSDAIASIANYLRIHKWSTRWQDQHKAILGYNNDDGYRDFVLEYRESLLSELFTRECYAKALLYYNCPNSTIK